MKLKIYETAARYILGVYYLFGAVDGFLNIFFGISLSGEHSGPFLGALFNTLWFWVFMKLVQLIGAVSLIANYRPALGLALVTPITVVISLFYFFDLKWYAPLMVNIALTVILLRAYWPSFSPLLHRYK